MEGMEMKQHLSAQKTSSLFKPLYIRSLALSNRIVMAPMTRCFSPDGIPGQDVAAYYQRRAEGGTGLIITEGVGIDHPTALGEGRPGQEDIPHLYGEQAMAGWKAVVDKVHEAGGRIIPQLWHQGPFKIVGTGPQPDAVPSSPSGVWGPMGRTTSTPAETITRITAKSPGMTDSDIGDVISAFARSASHAKSIGFDGIALHGAHGYLIDSFLWQETNFRKDGWGGDALRRTRFAVEVIAAIRKAVGDDMPIFFRFSQWKQQDFKARLAESAQELETVLGPLADAGVDVFDASTRYFNRAEFPGSELNLAGWARKLTGKMSMTVGGVGLDKGLYDSRQDGKARAANNIDLLMERFNRGEFDLVGVGRSLLADPEWSHKLRLGQAFEPFEEGAIQRLW